MADKNKREAEWAKAKQVCRLNAETVLMAKELGLNPRSPMKNIPSKSQPWKAPVHVWIRDMYKSKQEKAAHKRACCRARIHETNSLWKKSPRFPPESSISSALS